MVYRNLEGIRWASTTIPTRFRPGSRFVEARAACGSDLDARAAHPGATLTDLGDPDAMLLNLHRALHALDRAVDRLYRRGWFASEREGSEYLLMP